MESYDQPRQYIKKQRHYFANKVLSSQDYGLSIGHVLTWELDYKESWAPKNWCFWTVVLEKTLESPLDCKEIKPVHPKGNQSGCSWEGLMLKWNSNTLATWCEKLTHLKRPCAGKDWGEEEKGMTEDEMLQWHHWLDRHGFVWTPGVGDGQGGLACCSSWGHKKSDMTEQLMWTNPVVLHFFLF